MSRRESHDARAFYERFTPPKISTDDRLAAPAAVDRIWCGDARDMDAAGSVADGSVALVVTSPPYYAGKEYEADVGAEHVPGSYFEYLELLHDVFAECVRKLEPGGRIAVNVANLGRKPYRSLSSDVIRILQDDLQLLLRGEIVWKKGDAAGGSCAWGTYQHPRNPVLRDISERVVVASKGRFDRARSVGDRAAGDHPSQATITSDEFLEATTDVWHIQPESAHRVGHPAPFPVELPQRLIELYTYRGDLVLDPFMGVGSTAVAAVRTDRRFAGFDLDPGYIERAHERIDAERVRVAAATTEPEPGPDDAVEVGGRRRRALAAGRRAKDIARAALEDAGFTDIEADVRCGPGLSVDFRARSAGGHVWHFLVPGGLTSTRPGLRRAETLWKTIGRAAVLGRLSDAALIVLATHVPKAGTSAAAALAAVTSGDGAGPVFDVVDLQDTAAADRLASHAAG